MYKKGNKAERGGWRLEEQILYYLQPLKDPWQPQQSSSPEQLLSRKAADGLHVTIIKHHNTVLKFLEIEITSTPSLS